MGRLSAAKRQKTKRDEVAAKPWCLCAPTSLRLVLRADRGLLSRSAPGAWRSYCNETFDNEFILIEHQKKAHFGCAQCRETLDSPVFMRTHCRRVHSMHVEKCAPASRKHTRRLTRRRPAQGARRRARPRVVRLRHRGHGRHP